MRHYRDIPPWREVSEEQWGSWKWQLSHRITRLHQLEAIVNLTPQERDGIRRATAAFPLSITPYYASLMDPDDPRCPVRMLAVPSSHELTLAPEEREDPLDEQVDAPVPLIVHRYPDRVLLLITDMCSMYCRHCTRRHFTAEYGHAAPRPKIDQAIEYIRRTPAVRDVLVSGGDALLVGDDWLDYVLGALRAIPHVEVVRLGTRMPVVCPQRITPALCAMLRRHHPLYLNTHFNHSKEITPEAVRACEMLVDAGIPVGNQVVLLRDLNDCPVVMKQLMHDCVRMRVRPYYIYQCDMTPGLSHFRTSIGRGLEIMEMLRGHTSGFAVPTYVVDAPGGGGKVPIMPNYVLSMSEDKVVLRNYEGVITSYTQPRYPKRSEDPCPLCGTDHRQLGGLGELFYGGRTAMEPAGLARRRRGGGGHSHAHEGVGAAERSRGGGYSHAHEGGGTAERSRGGGYSHAHEGEGTAERSRGGEYSHAHEGGGTAERSRGGGPSRGAGRAGQVAAQAPALASRSGHVGSGAPAADTAAADGARPDGAGAAGAGAAGASAARVGADTTVADAAGSDGAGSAPLRVAEATVPLIPLAELDGLPLPAARGDF